MSKEPNPPRPSGTVRPSPPPPPPPPIREIYESKSTPEPPRPSAADYFRQALEKKNKRRSSPCPEPPPAPPPKVIDQTFADLYRKNIRLTSANHVLEKELKRLNQKK